MATKVTMPQLGESVTEGTINRWLVKAGDRVHKYDSLCEVSTDKVNAEVPSSYEGTITDIVAEEGETIKVGGLICYIEETGDNEGDEEESKAENGQENEQVSQQENKQVVHGQTQEKDQSMKKRYSPAVLKLAQEHGIDLDQVQGTGRSGRITRKDVLKLIETGTIPKAGQAVSGQDSGTTDTLEPEPGTQPVSSQPVSSVPNQDVQLQVTARDREIPISGVRRTIANKMVQSKHEIPHAWTMVEVDVTDLVHYRNKTKDEFKRREGVPLTFLPFFIKATVEALKEYPQVNAQWAGDKIIQKKDINMSIAVAAENDLYVPVIPDADQRSISGLAQAITDLAHRTRSGNLKQEDVQGGTFTVNNTGSFGSIQSQPIINYPQAAILSVEQIVQRPVIIEGMIAVRQMVNLCFSFDHRILDGIIVGGFLQSIKQKMEAMGEGTSLY